MIRELTYPRIEVSELEDSRVKVVFITKEGSWDAEGEKDDAPHLINIYRQLPQAGSCCPVYDMRTT